MSPESKKFLGVFSAEFLAGTFVQLSILLVLLTLAWSRMSSAQDRLLDRIERFDNAVESLDSRTASIERGITQRLVWEARHEASIARIETKVDELRERAMPDLKP